MTIVGFTSIYCANIVWNIERLEIFVNVLCGE